MTAIGHVRYRRLVTKRHNLRTFTKRVIKLIVLKSLALAGISSLIL